MAWCRRSLLIAILCRGCKILNVLPPANGWKDDEVLRKLPAFLQGQSAAYFYLLQSNVNASAAVIMVILPDSAQPTYGALAAANRANLLRCVAFLATTTMM